MKIQLLRSYLLHQFNSVNEYGIHSPYFFDFYCAVIKGSRKIKADPVIEKLRKSLQANHKPIEIKDWEGGSVCNKRIRTPADIVKTSVSPQRLSLLYQHILRYIRAQHVVELGTSVGLNSLYLASQETIQVFTFEGSGVLAHMATAHFAGLNKKNIQLIEGNITATLPSFIERIHQIDFALIDANHRYKPTIQYFDLLAQKLNTRGIIAVNDIYWSAEMEKTWKALKHHKLVYGSIDLYRCGLLFFNPALNRQHFVCSL